MASFAAPTDLAAYLQQTVDTATAQLLLDMATAKIQEYCGWPISSTPGDVAKLTGSADGSEKIFLPSLYVTAIGSIVAGGVTLTSTQYSWSSHGVLTLIDQPTWNTDDPTLFTPRPTSLLARYPWPTSADSITVTFDHGYATVPNGVKDVCLALSARSYANPQNVISETMGSYSVRYDATRSSAVTLTDMDRVVLDGYRIVM